MTAATTASRRPARPRERRVYADAVAFTPLDSARARLWDAMHAIAAHTDGLDLDFGLRIGPRRGRPPYKYVAARLGRLTKRHATVVLPVRWRPTGRLAGLYPTLTGSFGLTPIDPSSCLVSFTGSYVPPLGRVGAAVDRSAMSRVADATARALTAQLAAALSTHDSSTRSLEGQP